MNKIKRYGGIIIRCEDEVLLCKRNNEGSLPGVWSIPAGKLTKNESPLEGSLREFFEETNIEIKKKIDLVGFINRKTRDGKSNKGLMYVFLCDVDEKICPDLENAVDGDEHSMCSYFNINNLPFEDENDQLCRLIKRILQ